MIEGLCEGLDWMDSEACDLGRLPGALLFAVLYDPCRFGGASATGEDRGWLPNRDNMWKGDIAKETDSLTSNL